MSERDIEEFLYKNGQYETPVSQVGQFVQRYINREGVRNMIRDTYYHQTPAMIDFLISQVYAGDIPTVDLKELIEMSNSFLMDYLGRLGFPMEVAQAEVRVIRIFWYMGKIRGVPHTCPEIGTGFFDIKNRFRQLLQGLKWEGVSPEVKAYLNGEETPSHSVKVQAPLMLALSQPSPSSSLEVQRTGTGNGKVQLIPCTLYDLLQEIDAEGERRYWEYVPKYTEGVYVLDKVNEVTVLYDPHNPADVDFEIGGLGKYHMIVRSRIRKIPACVYGVMANNRSNVMISLRVVNKSLDKLPALEVPHLFPQYLTYGHLSFEGFTLSNLDFLRREQFEDSYGVLSIVKLTLKDAFYQLNQQEKERMLSKLESDSLRINSLVLEEHITESSFPISENFIKSMSKVPYFLHLNVPVDRFPTSVMFYTGKELIINLSAMSNSSTGDVGLPLRKRINQDLHQYINLRRMGMRDIQILGIIVNKEIEVFKEGPINDEDRKRVFTGYGGSRLTSHWHPMGDLERVF